MNDHRYICFVFWLIPSAVLAKNSWLVVFLGFSVLLTLVVPHCFSFEVVHYSKGFAYIKFSYEQ